MPNYFFATDSQTAEDLQNELLTSTTRKLGNNLLHETQASSRRRKGIKEELSRRIRLMQKIPDSHPREIFVYTDKGYKSFTQEIEDILTRDLLRKPQKGAVPKYLNYTRGMLKDEIEKGKKAQPVSKEGERGQEEGNDQLKEEYELLVEEFGAMEAEHGQLIEKYQQLKKDHVQLQKEHERVLHELSGRREMQAKAPEQKSASAADMRPRDEGPKRPQVLGDKPLPPEIQRQAREAQEAQEARERASAQAREEEEAKIREWEEESFVKEMNKRERELRAERAAREKQRLGAPPQDLPGKERLDIKAGDAAPQMPHHYMHGALVDSEPTRQTSDQQQLSQGQKIAYPNMQQYLPYQPKSALLRQANGVKSVSFDLPMETPNKEQEPPAEQKPHSLQQTNPSKSVSTGRLSGTPTMGQTIPAQQPPLQRAPLQQPPTQQAPIGQAHNLMGFPYGPPTGTLNVGQVFPVQQQANDLKSVSSNIPLMTAPTSSIQSGPQVASSSKSQESPKSQEPGKSNSLDEGSMIRTEDPQRFIRLLDP